MCGIIGKIGVGDVVPELLNGLKRLEYRGYDSSGIAVLNNNAIERVRTEGRIENLEKKLAKSGIFGNVGIGHTRWATHGVPTEENAHPHISPNKKFALVHNGIIENAEELKKTLLPKDEAYQSDTDTEVAVHLIEKFYNGDVIQALSRVCRELKGSYAFGVICVDFPNTVFGVANGSPLVAVKGESGCYIASDISAVGEKTDDLFRLTGGEICTIEESEIKIYDSEGDRIEKFALNVDGDELDKGKGTYEHYMLKEIYEQPQTVRNTVMSFVKDGKISFSRAENLENFFKTDLKKIVIIACGSAYHTGLVGKSVIEKLCKIECGVEIASEFRYSEAFVNENTLAVFISQSGETADTIAALRLAKSRNAKILSIVNVKNSTIAEESENVIYTKAGRETAVATTKAYSAQLTALYALAIRISSLRGRISVESEKNLTDALLALPSKITKILIESESKINEISEYIAKSGNVFFIGRLADYATVCEGSLKMKEISYINSQAYASGELKHGTISLIDNGIPVVAVACENEVFSKTLANISEVKARGAKVILITDCVKDEKIANCDFVIKIPKTQKEFQSSLSVIPLQILAYRTAKSLGCDIDKPKNLAKSVTVE